MTGAVDAIRRLAEDVGIRVWVAARRLGPADPAGLALAATDPVPMASLYKLHLAACWSDLVAAGAIDPLDRLRLDTHERAAGPTGVSVLLDDVEVSQRDAVRLMLNLSDNAAAEGLLGLVGIEALAAWLTGNDLTQTNVRRGSAASWRAVVAETGGGSPGEAPTRLANVAVDIHTSEYDAALASATTANDLVALLDLIWREPRHAFVKDSLRLQAWRHRIGSGFPHDDVDIYGKTGSLGRLRHEAAVVQFPGEVPIGVAVLTRAARAELHQPRVDQAIGAIAHRAVGVLRAPLVPAG